MNVGIDIIEVKRIKSIINDEKKIRKVFSSYEIDYCRRFKKIEERFAGKFAAKEAVIKALKSSGKNIISKISLKDIEILNKDDGSPFVFIKGLTINGTLSISHTSNYAVAVFIYLK